MRAKVNANDLARVYNTVITIDQAHFKLRLFKGLKFRKSYGVAVGQPAYPTPSGRFAIQNKQVNPVWSVPNSPWAGELQGTTVDGGSAANPLKARWMGIANGVGIHGTGEDYSIGTRASHGCIRMHVRRRHRPLQARPRRDACAHPVAGQRQVARRCAASSTGKVAAPRPEAAERGRHEQVRA